MASVAVYATPFAAIAAPYKPRVAVNSPRIPAPAAPRALAAAANATDAASLPGGNTIAINGAAPAVAPPIVAVPAASNAEDTPSTAGLTSIGTVMDRP